jgi:BlaI family penicillinase repressor
MRLSDAEWTIMRVVWRRAPASARDVVDEIAPATGWAYTTVKTMMARLVEKGALAERKRGHVSLYEPRVTEQAARRSALESLVDRAFGGMFGSLVQHLVAEERLSARDVEALRRLMDDAETPREPARPVRRRGRVRKR